MISRTNTPAAYCEKMYRTISARSSSITAFFIDIFISVRNTPACQIPLSSAFIISAAYLLRKLCRIVFRISLKHTFKDNALGCIRNELCCGDYFCPVIFELFFVHCHFILIARKTIQFIDNNIRPFFSIAILNHTLKIRTVIVRARHSTVDISIQNQNIIFLRIFFTDTKLTFDRLLCLTVRRIPRIDDCCFYYFLPCILLSFFFDFSSFGGDQTNGNA